MQVSQNMNPTQQTPEQQTPEQTSAPATNPPDAPTRPCSLPVLLGYQYNNIAYTFSIQDPSLAPFRSKLEKIVREDWQHIFCINVRDAKTCEAFIATYEDRFGKL